MTPLESEVHDLLCLHQFPAWERDYRFESSKRWRFDFAWVQAKVALEVEAGLWTGGRHPRPAGFIQDLEKYHTALFHGWQVFRVHRGLLQEPAFWQQLRQFLQERTACG